MAVYFTGTSTGQAGRSGGFYQAGQVYSNGNGAYLANADGSFRNLNTGRTAVGSSQSDRVTFVNTGSLASGSGSSGGSPASAGPGAGSVKSGSSPGTGAGNSGAVSGGSAPGSGPGVPGVQPTKSGGGFLGAGFLRADAVMGIKTTPIFIDGKEAPRAKGWSDGGDGEDRWGEWGGGLYGLGVMVADGYVATGFKGDKAASDVASAAADFATFVVERRNTIKADQGWDAYTADKRLDQRRTVDTAGVWQTGGGF